MLTVFLVLLALPAAQATQLSDAVVVSSHHVGRDPKGDYVEFSVTNRASIAVTAWQVVADVTFSDGSRTGRGLDRDGYSAFEGVRRGPDSFIPPQATVWARIPLGQVTSSIADIRLAVRWAVFADRSSFGDTASVQALFSRREAEYRALGVVASALEAAAVAKDGPKGLQVALDRLNSLDQDDPEHSVKRQMRINLRYAIDRSPMVKVSPAEFIRHWRSTIGAQLKAADEHRHPRSR